MTQRSPFRHFKTSPRLSPWQRVVHQIPSISAQRRRIAASAGSGISHKSVRSWRSRYGPLLVTKVRKRSVFGMRWSRWQRYLDEVFTRVNGARCYRYRAAYQGGVSNENIRAGLRSRLLQMGFEPV